MKISAPKTIILSAVIACSMFAANAQSFRFKNFDSNVGLPQNFVYCVEQENNGYLWIGTGEGLVRYDGHRFQTYLSTDSLAEDFIMSLFVATNGNVWIGHNNGNLSFYRNNRFTPVIIPETNSPVRHICQDKSENIWAVIQNSGPVRIDTEGNITTFFDPEKLGFKLFYSIYPVSDNTLLLGTSEGLLKVTIDDNSNIASVIEIEDIPLTIITTITPRKGISDEYWIGTEDYGFFRYSQGSSDAMQIIDNRLCLTFNIEHENIKDIVEEDEGHLLIATWGNGVIKLFFDPVRQDFNESYTFSSVNGLADNYVNNILCDREGNYWFATFGGGLSVLLDESMIFYNLAVIGLQDSKAHSVYKAGNSLYIGLDNGFLKADPYCYTDFEFYDVEMGIPRDAITGFYQSKDNILWIASEKNGLFYQKPGDKKFVPYNYSDSNTGKQIRGITGYGDRIYLATIGGYFNINIKTDEITHLTTESGLPHNNINFVYCDTEGRIWIGPKNSGICSIENDSLIVHRISQTPIDVYGIAEDMDGNRWLATQGKGVLRYGGDSLQVISVSEGLAKNFCYSIVADRANRLWVTHKPGLSCIDLAENKIRTYGYEENLGADFSSSFVDNNNTLWFSSSQGVINYFPEKDHDNQVSPTLNFTRIRISGKQYELTNLLQLKYPYREKYNIRFDFIGISFKNPKGVTYQYQLQREGDEPSNEWVEQPTTWWEREYMPDGNWVLRIRSANADGIHNSDPLTIRIQIAQPIWKKGWVYLILITLLVYLGYVIINKREKKLKQQKELLQKEVASQTVILREQKAEIERKNRDITDSINYAKRIQTSILPPLNSLKERFPESFIFFSPRDIVSGDFYWFHKWRGKFILCCADCTGHGVPGAFMSMIGTTLLNDIIKHPDINSPADMLTRLDIEIRILLQQNSRNDIARDGMDISIVEIDPSTKKIRIASAKRPVYLFLNNELTIYKGTRRSIGDEVTEDSELPEFVNIEYNAKIKDTIYLFSDGYGDQFGGPYGRKYMTSSIKNMLMEIHRKPMNEQYVIVEKTFINWKDYQEQVDDVIFIGIQI